MLGVTLTPTMAHASDKINVIPSRAYLKIDCRVPPGLGEDTALERLREVLGDTADTYEIEFTEKTIGNVSPVESELMVEECDRSRVRERAQHRAPHIAGEQLAAEKHDDGQNAESDQGEQRAPDHSNTMRGK